jgi:hypothetical protein
MRRRRVLVFVLAGRLRESGPLSALMVQAYHSYGGGEGDPVATRARPSVHSHKVRRFRFGEDPFNSR